MERGCRRAFEDVLAVEEPLEIRLGYGPLNARSRRPVSLTMRTPGHDRELAAGFLFTEGIVQSRDELLEIRGGDGSEGDAGSPNGVRVELRPEVEVDLGRLQRHFYTTSSCGVCGKSSLEALEVAVDHPSLPVGYRVAPEVLMNLPETLRAAQPTFDLTGGLHAAALFDREGGLRLVREDVGRHNALDKLIGALFLGEAPAPAEPILLLSGRASFELLQKALVWGFPVVASVGAPSSLAVQLAERFGITLVGWVRAERFNLYSHPERIEHPQNSPG